MPSSLIRQATIVICFVALSVWLAQLVFERQETERQTDFQHEADQLSSLVTTRIEQLFTAVEGVKGFLTATPALSAQQFKHYLDNSRFFVQFPAARAIAFSPKVPAEQLARYNQSLQQDKTRAKLGYPQLQMTPRPGQDLYFPAVLVAPLEGNNKVHGFDLWSDPTRRAAAIRARNSGLPNLSAPITLTQDQTSAPRSVLYLTPVYKTGTALNNEQARIDALSGFIPVGITPAIALQSYFDTPHAFEVALRIYDAGTANQMLPDDALTHERLLFDSHSETAVADSGYSARRTLDMGERQWRLEIAQLHPSSLTTLYGVPALILLLGGSLGIGAARLLEDMLTHWRDTRKQLRLVENEIAAFFDMSVDMFCVIGFDGRFKQLNDAWEQILGYPHEDSLSTPVAELIHPEDRDATRQQMEKLRRGEAVIDYRNRYLAKDGSYRWLSWRCTASLDEQLIFAVARDVSDKLQTEARIQKLAYYDALTALANRSHFMEQLNREVQQAARRKAQLAIFYIDLDGFKDINDSLGHDAGDRLLQKVAARLKLQLRAADFAARLGGDEFCILINDLSEDYSAPAAAQRLLQEINKPLTLDTQEITPRASIGIAYYPADGQDTTSLLKAADSAMYSAKHAGKHRYACYQPHMTVEAIERLQLEQDLRAAIPRGELELHYQPQVSLQTGKLTGVEALARWRHPTRGLLMPNQFIDTAERLKIIDDLGEWVLNTACQQTVHWHQERGVQFTIAVNISPLHFEVPTLITAVEQALLTSGLPAHCLELEITETRALQTEAGRKHARLLREMGVKVAVDDFGTGYSSLTLLKDLELDTIKIDRSFIKNVADSPEAAVLLGTIIGSAHAFGAKVVAEGVETLEQARILYGVNCDQVQGYYFCHPVPAVELPSPEQQLYPENRASEPA